MAEAEEPKRKEMARRLHVEHDAIISSVGLVTRVWATLESSLFEMFHLLSRIPDQEREAAGVIFYTPSNTETRVSLVDNLVSYRCEIHTIGEIDQRLCTLWGRAKGKINALKNTRNAIVHGTLTNVAMTENMRVRLTPAYGDTLRFLPPIREGRMPGFGSNELRVHEQAVWRLNVRLRTLCEAFRLRMQLRFGPHRGDEAQRLLELLPRGPDE
jgi:hypothetical protein